MQNSHSRRALLAAFAVFLLAGTAAAALIWSDHQHLELEVTLGLLASILLAYVAKLLLDLSARNQGLEALVNTRMRELREGEVRYRDLFDANPQPMWVYDLETLTFLAVNDAAVKHYGYSRDEFLQMRITDIRSQEEAARLMHRVDAVRKADVRDAGVWQHRRKDGTLIQVEVTAHTLDFGGRRGQIVHVSDITKRLESEAKTRENEERYRALTELSSDWYWEQDEDSRITLLSTPKSGTYGADLGAFLGKTRREVPDVVYAESRLAALEAMIEARQPFLDFDIDRTYRDGPTRNVQLSGEPKFDASGRFAGYRGIGRDVTERRERDGALQRFSLAMDASADGIYVVDRASMRFIHVNASACAMLGREREDILASGPEGVLSVSREELTRIYDEVIAGRGAAPVELPRQRPDGRKVWVEIQRRAKLTDAGWTIVTVSRDITERKRAEADLRLAASVFDHAQEGIFITDVGANIVSTNKRFTEITGYCAGEAIGRNPRLLKSGRQGSDFYRSMWAFINTHGYWTGELWNRRKDGVEYPQWLSISAVRDDHGQVINYVAMFVDISQRVAAEQALRVSEEKFGKAFRSSPVFVSISTVADGRYIDVNDAFLRGTGHSRDAVIGNTASDIGLWKTAEDRQRAIDLLLREGRVSRFEAELCKKSGESMACEIWAEPITIEDRPCVIWVTSDVSVRKKTEVKILQLNAELEQRVAERTRALEVANTELEAFAYSVSHDLRAPLRAIQGFSNLVETQYASQLGEQGQHMLRRVGAGAQKMGLLIDDLLRLSRISRQAMKIQAVDLSALVRELAEELQAGEPGRRVEWIIAPQVTARGDAGLLRAALQNLIGNAWKYTSRRDAAHIEFGVAEQDGRPVYFVRDNGAGFDMTYAQKLFGAFQRLHSSTEFPGSGIGLATVARILHRHGGKVWAEGRVDEGATFYFSFG